MGRSPFLGPEPLHVAGDEGARLEDAQSPVPAEALCPPTGRASQSRESQF